MAHVWVLFIYLPEINIVLAEVKFNT